MFWQNVHQLDQQITLTINSWNSSLSDPFWAFMSMKLVWIPLYAAILALIIWKLGWKKGGVLILFTVLSIILSDQIANLVKFSVERIRPLHDEFMVRNGLHILELGGGYSFFSAHSSTTFSLATVTWYGLSCNLGADSKRLTKWYGAIMFTWAFLVAISRIFVGKHYLGDVLVGIMVGLIIGFAMGKLSGILSRKIATK